MKKLNRYWCNRYKRQPFQSLFSRQLTTTIANNDEEFNLTLLRLIKDNEFNKFMDLTQNIDDLSDVIYSYGENLMHIATQENPNINIDLLKYLVNKKCYTNMVDNYSASILYYSSISESLDAVKYLISLNVDPRISSAFSGQQPKDVSEDNNIKNILTDYTQTFENKLLPHPYGNYLYRISYHWRTAMHSLMHPNPEFYGNYAKKYHPMAVSVYEQDGFKSLIDICKEVDKQYIYFMHDKKVLDYKRCMICQCSMDIGICPHCQKVPICVGCWSHEDHMVKSMVQIHTNNCKTGIFDDYSAPESESDSD
eukprot:221020_1